jgi:GT2 family glycosyltransferase
MLPLDTELVADPILSIIVVNYCTYALTLECLRSVARETSRNSYEVLLVDNGSGDGLVETVAHEMRDVRLFPLEGNVGFARANNLAAAHARGKFILLLNSDTVVLDRAVDRLLAFAAQQSQAKIWGGRTLLEDGRLNPASCWRRMTLWNVFCRSFGLAAIFPSSRLFNPEAYGGWRRSTVREVDIVSGCFMMIDKELWQKLGGLDERFFLYGEDSDLCLRAASLGARPVVTPDATIVHHGGSSPQIDTDRRIRLLAAKMELIKRHFPPLSRSVAMRIFVLWPFFRALFARRRANGEGCADKMVWRRRGEWSGGLEPLTGFIEREGFR